MNGHGLLWKVLVRATVMSICAGLNAGLVSPAAEPNPANCPELASQAEAKMKAKQFLEAVALWERVVALNPVVGDYWARLASARYDAKDYRKAIPAHEKALELRAGSPWVAAYDIGCCYALLGEKEPALKWVQKSFALGFRRLENALNDDDLKSLHDDPRFRELVDLVDVAKMSRVEGWRYDLKLLVRELKRLHYNLSKKAPPEGFDAFVHGLNDDIPKLTDHQIEASLMKLMRMAGDGHTGVYPRYLLRESRRAIPVDFYWFEEGVFITDTAPAHKELAGLQVLRVGGHTVAKALEACDPLISRDNEMWPRLLAAATLRQPQLLNGLGLIPEDDKVTLTLRNSGGMESTVTLTADAGEPGDDWVSAR